MDNFPIFVHNIHCANPLYHPYRHEPVDDVAILLFGRCLGWVISLGISNFSLKAGYAVIQMSPGSNIDSVGKSGAELCMLSSQLEKVMVQTD